MALALPGTRARRLREAAATVTANATILELPPRPATSSAMTSWTPAGMVTRDLALAIPAVRRARHVIAGTIGSMSLVLRDTDGTPITDADTTGKDVTSAFLTRPDPDHTLTWLLAATVDDLMFYGRAYWRITHFRAGSNIPDTVQREDPTTVTQHRDTGQVWIAGQPVTPGTLIVFEHYGPTLTDPTAAGTILNALEVEAAALRYARTPQPQAVIKNLGAVLDDDESDALVAAYETARRTSSTAFLNAAVELETQGWDPSQLQLVEARQHMAAEIARIANLDARWINAPSETAMTYTNIQDLRRDLVDITLRPYMSTIDQTLSVNDAVDALRDNRTRGYQLCTRGKTITLDPRNFLRLSDPDRAALWQTYIASGVLTVDEARALEPLAPQGMPR